jgi:tetratricopeptide (TPR) repeat protein
VGQEWLVRPNGFLRDLGKYSLAGARLLTAGLLVFTWAHLQADDYAELFRKAAAYTQQGRYEQAIAEYKAALAIRPGAPEALNNLAVMYYELGKYSDAFDIASKIWANHPELKSAALITGMAAIQTNRPKEAVPPLEKILASNPADRDALLGLASARFALNEFSEAAQLYEKQTVYSPNDSKAWYGLAICYEKMAENASKQLSRTPGGAAYSRRLLAEYLQSAGDDKLAAEAFGDSKAMATDSSPEALKQYETARRLSEKSRTAFERFVNLAPDSWQTSVFLGDVDRQHGNLVSALAHYKKAADEQPKNPAPLLGLGTTYWEMGNFDRAAACLKQTLALNPNAHQALFELANIAVRRHAEAEAIPLLKQYLAAQPDALAAHADLGRAYLHLGQYKDAVAELTRAAESDERGDVHYQLSIALRKLGRIEEADSAMKKSTELREAQLQHERQLKK